MRKHAKIWFVLADGARVRIIAHRVGDREVFTDVHYGEIEPAVAAEARLPARALASDRPGRTHESATPTRHAVDWKTDPHEEAKERFGRRVAELLNQAAAEELYDGLVLVAPSRALGVLRRRLGAVARERLVREEGKDLSGLPDRVLRGRLAALLAS